MLLQSFGLEVHYQAAGNTLVPSEAFMDAVESSGSSYHNSVNFSHCHVFEAESRVLDSSVQSMTTVLNNYKKQQSMLASGLTLQVQLDQPIEAKNAMVGNLVRAHLDSAVSLPQGLVIPKGAFLHGRIRQFERVDKPGANYIVELEFTELEWGDHYYRFLSRLKSMDSFPGIAGTGSNPQAESRGVGTGTKRTIENSPVMEADGANFNGSAIPGVAVLVLTNAQSIPQGFRMIWQTR